MNALTTIIILQALIFGGFSAWLAKQKNRDMLGWFILGALFSFIALIAIAAVPSPPSSKSVEIELLGEEGNKETILLQKTFSIIFGIVALIVILALIFSHR